MRKLLHAAEVVALLQAKSDEYGGPYHAALALRVDPSIMSRALNGTRDKQPGEMLPPALLKALKLEKVNMYAEKGTYRRVKS